MSQVDVPMIRVSIPGGDGCAYGSHMGVQRPHGHGDSSGKSKPVCPLGCQFPCLGVAGVGFCEQMGEHFLQGRIKFFENFAGRKTPTIVKKYLLS